MTGILGHDFSVGRHYTCLILFYTLETYTVISGREHNKVMKEEHCHKSVTIPIILEMLPGRKIPTTNQVLCLQDGCAQTTHDCLLKRGHEVHVPLRVHRTSLLTCSVRRSFTRKQRPLRNISLSARQFPVAPVHTVSEYCHRGDEKGKYPCILGKCANPSTN